MKNVPETTKITKDLDVIFTKANYYKFLKKYNCPDTVISNHLNFKEFWEMVIKKMSKLPKR